MNGLALNWNSAVRGYEPTRESLNDLGGYSVEIDSLSAPEWDRIVAGFDDLNLFQSAAFADGLRGERNISHLLLRRQGIPVAGARVAIIKPPGLPIGLAYVKNGPFWRRVGAPPDEGVFEAAIAALIQEYARRRGHMITISPRPHPRWWDAEARLLRKVGFAPRLDRQRPIDYFLVDTGTSEEALRSSLAQTWRSNLKRAERNRLDVRFREPMEALADFLALTEAMIARKQFLNREPLHLLPRIFERLPPSCSRIVTASHDGGMVAAAVLIIGGDVGYYLYGASADAALELRAGYALHWRIANWLRERGVSCYDLGDGFGSLAQFKRGLVGKSGKVLRAGEFDYWARPRARMIGSLIYGARDAIASVRSCRSWLNKKLIARNGQLKPN